MDGVKKPRNILTIMDAIEGVDPTLASALLPLRNSVPYTPPELLHARWGELMAIMQREAPPSHPQFATMIAIVNGSKDGPCPIEE